MPQADLLHQGVKLSVNELYALKAQGYQVDSNNQLQRQLFNNTMGWGYSLMPAKTESYIREGYMVNPHVYSVINKIITHASSVPFLLYEVKREYRKDFERYKAAIEQKDYHAAERYAKKALVLNEKSQLAKMLERPNETQNMTQFLEAAMGFKLLTGNNFIYGLEPSGYKGVFTKMYNMPSQLTEIVKGDWRNPVKGYRIYYVGGYNDYIPQTQVAHRKFWNPDYCDGGMAIYGMSPMTPLCRVVKRDNDSFIASIRMMQNGGPPGILSSGTNRPMSSEDASKMRRDFSGSYAGAENKNNLYVTNSEVTYQAMGLSSVDQQLLDSQLADLKEICRVYNVPLPLMNDESSTYNNIKEAVRSLWENACLPELIDIRSTLNDWLAKPWSEADGKQYYIDFDTSNIQALKRDEKEQVEALKNEIQSGIITPAMAQEIRGYEAPADPAMIELLNKYYMAGSVRPLDQPYKEPNSNNNQNDDDDQGKKL